MKGQMIAPPVDTSFSPSTDEVVAELLLQASKDFRVSPNSFSADIVREPRYRVSLEPIPAAGLGGPSTRPVFRPTPVLVETVFRARVAADGRAALYYATARPGDISRLAWDGPHWQPTASR
jgi:hypothetical protein